MTECECAAAGVPEGWVCGKPGCPRTVAAEKSISKIGESIREIMPTVEKPFVLPDYRLMTMHDKSLAAPGLKSYR